MSATLATCATCGGETETPSEWCYFGTVEVPTEDSEREFVETTELYGREIDVYRTTDKKDVEYYECDSCCPHCNESPDPNE